MERRAAVLAEESSALKRQLWELEQTAHARVAGSVQAYDTRVQSLQVRPAGPARTIPA